MKISTKYNFGDLVYITNDPEQKEYMVIGIIVRPGDSLKTYSTCYELDHIGETVEMYDFQLTQEKDVLKTLLNQNKEEE